MANAPKRVPLSARSASAIKNARIAKGWSQSELADRAKVPRARIKRIECRELSSIDATELTSICRKLGLLFRKKTPAKSKKTVRKKAKKRETPLSNATTKQARARATKRIRLAQFVLPPCASHARIEELAFILMDLPLAQVNDHTKRLRKTPIA